MSDNNKPTTQVTDSDDSATTPSPAAKRGNTWLKAAAGIAVAVLLIVVGGLALAARQDETVARQAGVASESPGSCTPAVMVVRHAEDGSNPAGGADILSSVGKKHAALYPKLFRDYLTRTHSVGPNGSEVPVCPIGRILAINPTSNQQNTSPGTNPYETIKPLAESLGLPIQTKDAAGVSYSTVYDWTAARRQRLLANDTTTPTSTVIAWDKQGLNPSADDLSNKTINGKKLGDYGFVPLLQALPADKSAIVGSGTSFTPQRTDFYVFTQQDPAAGTFAFAKAYKQSFSDDGGGTWYYTTALSSANNPNDIKV